MTHDQILTLIAPILSALVLGLTSSLSIVFGFGVTRLRAWLDAKNRAADSAVIADASARLQAAMQNGAGNIALDIQAGRLDITNKAAVIAAARVQEARIAAKVPGALAILQPLADSVLEGVMGKITTAAAGIAAPAKS